MQQDDTMQLMTEQEFRRYAHECLSTEALEPLYERIAEHNGEVARFGDAGPGSWLRINASIQEVRNIERQLARLERREPRRFYFNLRGPQ